MKLRHAVVLLVTVFLICLLVSAVAVRRQTLFLSETRRSALAATLGESRFEPGNRPAYMDSQFSFEAEDELSTAWVLKTLMIAGQLDKVDVAKGLNLIISEQDMRDENISRWGFEPYVTYMVVDCLKLLGALGGPNRTALLEGVTSMYNQSDGGFYEPASGGYPLGGLPLQFPGNPQSPYAHSNVISTFLAVSILCNINALDVINTTRTLNFILSCKAANGAFSPFPGAGQEWGNPFPVDGYGTGLPYTFAAVGTLKVLGVNVQDFVDPQKIVDYVVSLGQPYPPWQEDQVRFLDVPGETPLFAATWYGAKTLQGVGMVQNGTAICSKVAAYVESLQDLGYTASFPLPSGRDSSYGIFPDMNILEATYFAVDILNATWNLHILDQSTPIVTATWYNLIELSVLASVATAVAIIIFTMAYSILRDIRRFFSRPSKEAPSSDIGQPNRAFSLNLHFNRRNRGCKYTDLQMVQDTEEARRTP
jgi:hypothetical protein